MKRFLIFIISFVLLYIVFQILTGWILTALYTPDFSHIHGGMKQKAAFGNASTSRFIVALLPAIVAYLISQKTFKR